MCVCMCVCVCDEKKKDIFLIPLITRSKKGVRIFLTVWNSSCGRHISAFPGFIEMFTNFLSLSRQGLLQLNLDIKSTFSEARKPHPSSFYTQCIFAISTPDFFFCFDFFFFLFSFFLGGGRAVVNALEFLENDVVNVFVIFCCTQRKRCVSR